MERAGPDTAPAGRWRMLALLSLAEVAGMSPWFAASAAAAPLSAAWGLGPGEVGWLTGAVQLGFVAGTAAAALLNVADVWPSRAFFAASAALAALSNAALLLAPDLGVALALRFVTGACLAGVYPPAMKMIATWFLARRGLAVGTVVGALTVGKAMPYLVRAVEHAGLAAIVLSTSAGALAAGALVLVAYRDGPHRFPRRAFSWGLGRAVLLHRPTRLAVAGYLGHMWELYAMWTWVPAFLAASLAAAAARGGAAAGPAWLDDLLAFGAIAAGAAGCVWGGWVADRIGRERLVTLSLMASGACSLAIGLVFGASPWLVGALAWVWGFFVVADSAQFSTLVTEVAPRHAVGTALTLQTSAGFLLTVVTIWLVPLVVEISGGWRWAFAVLALGPLAGIAATRRLARLRREAGRLSAAAGA